MIRSVEVFSDEEGCKYSSDGKPDKESSTAKASHQRTDCARGGSRTLHSETSTKLQMKINFCHKKKLSFKLKKRLVEVTACSIF